MAGDGKRYSETEEFEGERFDNLEPLVNVKTWRNASADDFAMLYLEELPCLDEECVGGQ